ncbi:MAG: class I tRNA ligase family protein [Planctomycetes bacterium]|nr:class I tRNA ligase family protein [Planctomycetota bacterium]
MPNASAPRYVTGRTRPSYPARAVVTAGMPYGNKDLHFGHVGGVFVHADAFARFLRDRIGAENVIFVSGTDCYGSPIVLDHTQKVAAGEFDGTIEQFVQFNHQRQRATLEAYSIAPDLFAASALEPFRTIHAEMGAWILRTLHANGHLLKLTTPQFYDEQAGAFLTGRQVLGTCPVEGCTSEKAYADECSLGHQYEPSELIDPRSAFTGERPAMRDVTNWYVPVGTFADAMRPWLEGLLADPSWRDFAVRSLLEHFEPPTIHVKRDQLEQVDAVRDRLGPHRQEEGRAKSVKLIFDSLEQMNAARAVLGARGIRYRTGKTPVPFRLTGNLEWGLPVPEIDGLSGLTFWVWPESLWAPISFVAAHLEQTGRGRESWRDWWCSHEATVYQFIGEDNVYFYGLAQGAIWLGTQGESFRIDAPDGQLQMTHLVANRHLLFGDRKASSSGKVKPPMAADLLNYYTSDQLRAHFLSLGLGLRNGRFRPAPLDPKPQPGGFDPVLKDGNLLSNRLNRAVRSCFYTVQKYFDGIIPVGEVTPAVAEQCEAAILDFDEAFARCEFHTAMEVGGALIRAITSLWQQANPYSDDCDEAVRRQALIDAFHMVRVAIALMHPVAPEGTEKVRRYLRLGEEFWSWDTIFQPLYAFMADPASHRLEELPPRVDFFEKHPSQVGPDDGA